MASVQAILELQKAAKPQRLQQILASLYYLLTFNTEAHNYYFIVDPIDRVILTGRHIAQLEQLINRIINGTVQVVRTGDPICSALQFIIAAQQLTFGILQHYAPKTGGMAIITASKSLYMALFLEVSFSVKGNLAGIPGFELRPVCEPDMPQCICCIEHEKNPYGLFILANTSNADMAAKSGNTSMAAQSIGSILDDITRNHPSIEMVVRLELGGLDSKTHENNTNNIEARVHRVAEKSRVQVWVRQSGKFFNDKASSSDDLHEGGELRLRLPSENAKDNTVSILRFSDILKVIRSHCEKGVLLTGHPDNTALQAFVSPLDAFKFGFAALTAWILDLHAVECKARGVESKARFSSLSGSALATHRMSTGLGQIKAGGSGRRIYSAANASFLMSLLSACRLLGHLLRR
ncbi:hypothetical protein B0T18DRAFT_399184 [Schizothecium vesticola]|uniref:Uncharacterized protein n=1 Tax=Schizothecium vesticola TaxID=314040 RepID=A0AA40FB67_9PEZI|nr:hypothetical protein B0T18DRAFT_399184 [Schizothecium vesticola]